MITTVIYRISVTPLVGVVLLVASAGVTIAGWTMFVVGMLHP